MALAESDAMWTSLANSRPGFVAGISTFPSLHVAIGLWMFLTARAMAPRARPLAPCYFICIWIASVQLGWDYVSDRLAAVLGRRAIWALVGTVEPKLTRLHRR